MQHIMAVAWPSPGILSGPNLLIFKCNFQDKQCFLMNTSVTFISPQGILKKDSNDSNSECYSNSTRVTENALQPATNERIPRMWTFLLTGLRVNTVYSSAIWLGNQAICKEKNMEGQKDFQMCT